MPAAIVTGGAVRLGREIALHLARAGFDIALHYNFSRPAAEQTLKELKDLGVQSRAYAYDFTNLDLIPKLIAKINKDFKEVALLVNSAAIFPKGSIEETSTKELSKTIQINLMAPFILMREYKRIIRRGQIINILDQCIAKSLASHSAYSLSKSALARLTTLGAVEFGKKIRVNGIALGLILPFSKKDEDFFKKEKRRIPLKKTGNIEALLKGIEYLLLNSFVTGEILYIDGGESKV